MGDNISANGLDLQTRSSLLPPTGGFASLQNVNGVFYIVQPSGAFQTLIPADYGTVVTLQAPATNWDFATGLNGDTDGGYEVWGQITGDTTGRILTLLPNGVAPTFVGELSFAANTAVGAVNETTMVIGRTGASTDKICNFYLRLQSKSGLNRLLTSWSFDTPETPEVYMHVGRWTDTATVITSLRLQGSAANSLASGTIIWRKMGYAI